MKVYVSLYDYHLKSFFSNQKVRKDLKEKGFINSKGFIMYDPVYRSVMGAKAQNKKKITDNEMKSKLMSSIKGIDVPSRIKDKELDSKKVVLGQNTATNKKIPFIREPPRPNRKKFHLKKNHLKVQVMTVELGPDQVPAQDLAQDQVLKMEKKAEKVQHLVQVQVDQAKTQVQDQVLEVEVHLKIKSAKNIIFIIVKNIIY